MLPRIVRVSRRRRDDLPDTWTLDLVAADDTPLTRYAPGQFTMLYVFGVGEIPVSISGDAADPSRLVQTIRAVGKVSEAFGAARARRHARSARAVRHGLAGRRRLWPRRRRRGGRPGLAPLRPALYQLLAERKRFGKLVLLYGTRRPEDILFRRQLAGWRRRLDMEIEVTVDHAGTDWRGHVGVVTKLIPRLGVDAGERHGPGVRAGSDDALRRECAARFRSVRSRRSICRWSAT